MSGVVTLNDDTTVRGFIAQDVHGIWILGEVTFCAGPGMCLPPSARNVFVPWTAVRVINYMEAAA